MDTLWNITIPGDKRMLPVIEKIYAREREIERTFSITNIDSSINQFNHHGTPITNPEIIMMIKRAKEVYAWTNGAFDITIDPFLEAYGFHSQQWRVPPQSEISDLLKHVGFSLLTITDTQVSKTDPRVMIDLGGIVKGLALSEAVRILKENKVKHALVDAGGDLYAMGKDPMGHDWTVAVRDPRGEGIIGKFQVSDMTIYSSGDYERYFIDHDKRYFHIFDPHTGYPAWGLISTTVLYPDPFKGAGLSSSLFVMGKDRALAFIDSTPGAAAILVDEKGQRFFSGSLAKNMIQTTAR